MQPEVMLIAKARGAEEARPGQALPMDGLAMAFQVARRPKLSIARRAFPFARPIGLVDATASTRICEIKQ